MPDGMRSGDLTTPVFMWFVGILAAIVLVVWYARSTGIEEANIGAIDEDLKNLHYDLSLACNHAELVSDVSLHSAAGTLSYNESEICILRPFTNGNITRCLATPCPIGVRGEIDIGEVSSVRVSKRLIDGTPAWEVEGR